MPRRPKTAPASPDRLAPVDPEILNVFAPDGRPRIDRRVLAAKAKELDGTIRKLSAMRDGLRHAAVCPAPSHMECPTFRRLLEGAASGPMGRLRRKAARKAGEALR